MSAVCGLGATRAGRPGSLNKARGKSCGMGMQALLGERHTHTTIQDGIEMRSVAPTYCKIANASTLRSMVRDAQIHDKLST